MNSFIERIEIFPERQENGRILKHIEFRFPVFYEAVETVMGLKNYIPSSNVTNQPKSKKANNMYDRAFSFHGLHCAHL